MENNKENFGECFAAGRIINLDSAKIEDLERFISETNETLDIANRNLNKIIEEIKL